MYSIFTWLGKPNDTVPLPAAQEVGFHHKANDSLIINLLKQYIIAQFLSGSAVSRFGDKFKSQLQYLLCIDYL